MVASKKRKYDPKRIVTWNRPTVPSQCTCLDHAEQRIRSILAQVCAVHTCTACGFLTHAMHYVIHDAAHLWSWSRNSNQNDPTDFYRLWFSSSFASQMCVPIISLAFLQLFEDSVSHLTCCVSAPNKLGERFLCICIDSYWAKHYEKYQVIWDSVSLVCWTLARTVARKMFIVLVSVNGNNYHIQHRVPSLFQFLVPFLLLVCLAFNCVQIQIDFEQSQ